MGQVASRLLVLGLYSVGINFAAFTVAATLQTEKFYDLTGTMTFLTLVLKSLAQSTGSIFSASTSLRSQINSAMVMLWSSRLGLFLVKRVFEDGKDVRFDKVKTKPRIFLVYWMIQSFWAFITALPVYLLNSKQNLSDSKEDEVKIGTFDFIGWTLWIAGFWLQVTADSQKRAFRKVKENHGQFITTGVWAWCQHPNYFGEMVMWWGLFLSSNSAFRGLEHLAVVSPCFVVYLLTRVSGVPLLRKEAEKRWGNNAKWVRYVTQTNLLIPNPFATPV
mmetsp:Transcript_16848/g.20788  ORF Transcript_16848/g.20788 Transcript_16848/m.20788 type:complete len:276 (-) Transcript_16848:1117-1944(-)